VQRPWFGASLQPLTSDLAETLGLDRPSGALITKLHDKGPAARAGLKAGDVVVGVDDKQVQDPQAFQYRLITQGVGGEVGISVLRKGETIKTTIALVPPIEDPARDLRELKGRHPLNGTKVANLSPAVAHELNIGDDTREGVVVVEVEPRTAAARLGLKRGDLVVGVNNEKVTSVANLTVALELGNGTWRLAVERGGKVFTVTVQG